ncbi:MAG: hypothetical protein IKH37_07090 [Prevotella sp.]|nr:hypothetical protein [Prevotella sp.]
MVNKDNSERIERYLRDQMTPEENKAFLNDLQADKELREEAQMMALLIKEMKEEQAKQDEAITQEILASGRPATTKTIQLVKWLGSIAAMFILLFGANQWYSSYKIDKVYDAYYTPYDVSLARGGDDETVKKELAELYNKVGTEKDVTPIITRLQSIYDGIQTNSDDYSDYTYYENDIAWYLALAYIKDHNLEKAKEMLKPLANNGNEEAEKLIEELKKVE